jgi:hypothetical protein
MRNDNGSFDESDWTADERARLTALSSERIPPSALKQRTVRALHDRALLGRPARISTLRIVGLLLAASIVFVAGAFVGYAVANRRPTGATEPLVASTRAVAQLDSVDSATRKARHVVWY